MPAPDRPSRGKPSLVIRDEVADGAVRRLDTAITAPPPADPRPPPKEFRRSTTSIDREGPQPGPPRGKLDSREIAAETLLAELARESQEKRAALLEADRLRAALDAAKRAPPPVVSLTPTPDRKAFLKLLYSLGGALVLLMGAATAWLGTHTANVDTKVDNVGKKQEDAKVVTDPLPGQVAELERKNAALREWARLHADFDRQIFAKLGVRIHEPINAKPVDPIKTTTRIRKANSVTSGPWLEIDSAPPELP